MPDVIPRVPAGAGPLPSGDGWVILAAFDGCTLTGWILAVVATLHLGNYEPELKDTATTAA